MRVAVIGSGPAGVYAVDALTRHGDVAVDVFERLPAPFGLVRYGVAPDHLKMKSISATLHQVLEHPDVRFLGNVAVGTDLTLEELHQHYDAVLVAFGAAVDRRLGVPGEDLPGSFSATELVAWYSGHPDALLDRFTLAAGSVAVVGVGNVAVDVARVLAKTVNELRRTNLPDQVLQVLADSRVTDIHGRPRRLQLRFLLRPMEVLGTDRGERTPAGADPAGRHRQRRGNRRRADPRRQMLLRSVGYRGVGMPGMPFDDVTAVVPNAAGRVLRDGVPAPGEYVAGWIKRGPTGVIGTNKHDAAETVAALIEDAPTLPPAAIVDPDAVLHLLAERGVQVVTWEGWRAIDVAEAELGRSQGRERVKIADRRELLEAAAGSAAGASGGASIDSQPASALGS